MQDTLAVQTLSRGVVRECRTENTILASADCIAEKGIPDIVILDKSWPVYEHEN